MSTTAETEVERKYLSYGEAGTYCGVSRWSLYRGAKYGFLSRHGSASSPRFMKENLDAWMEAGAPTSPVVESE